MVANYYMGSFEVAHILYKFQKCELVNLFMLWNCVKSAGKNKVKIKFDSSRRNIKRKNRRILTLLSRSKKRAFCRFNRFETGGENSSVSMYRRFVSK